MKRTTAKTRASFASANPPAPKRTLEEELVHLRGSLSRRIQHGKESGDAALLEFRSKITTTTDALYQFEWLAGYADKIAEGAIYASIVATAEARPDLEIEVVAADALENLTNSLASNRWSGGSSSAFANAMNEQTRNAARRVVERWGFAAHVEEIEAIKQKIVARDLFGMEI